MKPSPSTRKRSIKARARKAPPASRRQPVSPPAGRPTGKALLEGEKHYRTLFEISPASIILIDAQGTILDVNPAFTSIFGYGREEAIGMEIQRIAKSDPPRRIRENLRRILSGQNLHHIVKNVRRNGEECFLDLNETRFSLPDGRDGILVVAADITDRVRSEEALRRSEARLSAILSSMTHMVFAFDAQGRFIFHHAPPTTPLFLPPAAFMGKKHGEVMPRHLHQLFAPAFRKNRRGEVAEYEYFLEKNGRVRWFSAMLSPIRLEGRFAGSVAVVTDITDRRRVENELKENEEKFRTVVEQADEGIVIIQDGIINYFNPYLEKVTGYSAPEVIGTPFARYINPDEVPQSLANYRKRMVGATLPEKIERALRHKSGSKICAELTGKMISYQGRPADLVLLRDITERKRIETILLRHSLVYTCMEEAVLIFDRQGVIIDVNPAAEGLFGRSREELLGRPAEILNPPELAKKISGDIMSTLTRGEVWRGEVPILAASGEIRTASTVVSCLRDQRGEWVGSVGINRDITGQRKMEEELMKAQKLESLGVLAGGLAHDFNNLLMSILGNISLARLSPDGPMAQARLLQEAENACQRAQTLTRQLLTFARGGSPVKQAVPVAPLVQETVGFVLRGSNVNCQFFFPPDLWPVEADPGQIAQVINNLVINADQAMPQGGTIQVRGENHPVEPDADPLLPGGRYVKISVLDSGVGIPAEVIGRIFDPFFSTKSKGTGLGLAVSYSIIRNHNGRITVDSDPGKGSTFCVYLPASDQPPVAAESPDPALIGGRGRVLLIEDEETVAEAVRRMLESLGYSVECAPGGAEGVERYARARRSGRPFEAVIADLTIPGGMGGREAVNRLRRIDPGVKAIVASGYCNDSVLADFRAHGFRGVLSKPFTLKELGAVLKRVFEEE